MPERDEIEPGSIRRALADTFILAFEPRSGHPFRVAGTRVCALFARELKGEAFLDLWSAESRKEMRDLLGVITAESMGVVASVSGTTCADARLGCELLLLPLSHHGRTDVRLVGALAPSERPTWLGTNALGGLTLGTHRYLDAKEEPRPAPRPFAPAAGKRHVRHGLVVYEGGQLR